MNQKTMTMTNSIFPVSTRSSSFLPSHCDKELLSSLFNLFEHYLQHREINRHIPISTNTKKKETKHRTFKPHRGTKHFHNSSTPVIMSDNPSSSGGGTGRGGGDQQQQHATGGSTSPVRRITRRTNAPYSSSSPVITSTSAVTMATPGSTVQRLAQSQQQQQQPAPPPQLPAGFYAPQQTPIAGAPQVIVLPHPQQAVVHAGSVVVNNIAAGANNITRPRQMEPLDLSFCGTAPAPAGAALTASRASKAAAGADLKLTLSQSSTSSSPAATAASTNTPSPSSVISAADSSASSSATTAPQQVPVTLLFGGNGCRGGGGGGRRNADLPAAGDMPLSTVTPPPGVMLGAPPPDIEISPANDYDGNGSDIINNNNNLDPTASAAAGPGSGGKSSSPLSRKRRNSDRKSPRTPPSPIQPNDNVINFNTSLNSSSGGAGGGGALNTNSALPSGSGGGTLSAQTSCSAFDGNESVSIATSVTSVLIPPLVSASPIWRRHSALVQRFISPYNSMMQIIAALDHESEGGKVVRVVPRRRNHVPAAAAAAGANPQQRSPGPFGGTPSCRIDFSTGIVMNSSGPDQDQQQMAFPSTPAFSAAAAAAATSTSSSPPSCCPRHTFVDGRYFVLHVERCMRYLIGDGTWFLTQTLPERLKELAVEMALQLFPSVGRTTFVFPGLPIAGTDQLTPIDRAQLKLQEDVWRKEAHVDVDTALIAFSPSPEGAGYPFGSDVIRMFGRLLKLSGYDVVTAPYSQHAQMVSMALAMKMEAKEEQQRQQQRKPSPSSQNDGAKNNSDVNSSNHDIVLFGPPELLLCAEANCVVIARDAEMSLVVDKTQVLKYLFPTPLQQQQQAERAAAAAGRMTPAAGRLSPGATAAQTVAKSSNNAGRHSPAATVTSGRAETAPLAEPKSAPDSPDTNVDTPSKPSNASLDAACAAAVEKMSLLDRRNSGLLQIEKSTSFISPSTSGAFVSVASNTFAAHQSVSAAFELSSPQAAASSTTSNIDVNLNNNSSIALNTSVPNSELLSRVDLLQAWVDLGVLVSSQPIFWMLRPNMMGSVHRLAERPVLLLMWFRQHTLSVTNNNNSNNSNNKKTTSEADNGGEEKEELEHAEKNSVISSTSSTSARCGCSYSVLPLIDAIANDCNPTLVNSADIHDKWDLAQFTHREKKKLLRGRAFVAHNPVFCPRYAESRELVPLSRVVQIAIERAAVTATHTSSSSSTTPSLSSAAAGAGAAAATTTALDGAAATNPSSTPPPADNHCDSLFGARFPFSLLMCLMSGVVAPRTLQLATMGVLRDSRLPCDSFLLRRCMDKFVSLDGASLKLLYDRLARERAVKAPPSASNQCSTNWWQQNWRTQRLWVRWFLPSVQPMTLADLEPDRIDAFAIANWERSGAKTALKQQQQQLRSKETTPQQKSSEMLMMQQQQIHGHGSENLLLGGSFGRGAGGLGLPVSCSGESSRNNSFSGPGGLQAAFAAPPSSTQSGGSFFCGDSSAADFGGIGAVRAVPGIEGRKTPAQSQALLHLIDEIVLGGLDIHLAPNDYHHLSSDDGEEGKRRSNSNNDSSPTLPAQQPHSLRQREQNGDDDDDESDAIRPPMRRIGTAKFPSTQRGAADAAADSAGSATHTIASAASSIKPASSCCSAKKSCHLPSAARYQRRTELGVFAMQTFSECALISGPASIRRNPFQHVGAAIAASHIHALDVLGYVREHPQSGLSIDSFGEALLFAGKRYPHIPFDSLHLLFELCRVHALTPGKITNVTPACFDGSMEAVEPVAVCKASPEVARMHIATRVAAVFPLVCRASWTQTPDREALAFVCLVRRMQRSLRTVYENTAVCVVLDKRFSEDTKDELDIDESDAASDREDRSEQEAELVNAFLSAAELQTPFELPLSSLAAMVTRALFDDHLVAGDNSNMRVNMSTNSRAGAGATSVAELLSIFPQLADCVVAPRGSQLAPPLTFSNESSATANKAASSSSSSTSSLPAAAAAATSSSSSSSLEAYVNNNNGATATQLECATAVVHSVFEFFFVAMSLLRRARRIAHSLPPQEVSRPLMECLNEIARPLADAEDVLKHKAKLLLGKDFVAERTLFD